MYRLLQRHALSKNFPESIVLAGDCEMRLTASKHFIYKVKNSLTFKTHTVGLENNSQYVERKRMSDLKCRIFNTKLWEWDPNTSFLKSRKIQKMKQKKEILDACFKNSTPVQALALKYLEDANEVTLSNVVKYNEMRDDTAPAVNSCRTQYPLQAEAEHVFMDTNSELKNKPCERSRRKDQMTAQSHVAKQTLNWMSDFELYNENPEEREDLPWQVNYGTPDPEVPVSTIPCGGCGAYLHCKEPSIPGYLPKEIFWGRTSKEMKSLVCQRCHFLKQYNVAIDVQVSPEDYPKILRGIRDERAIVIVVVDLLDFPCSIWPGLMDIIGEKRPVVIVGNKVDLIPGDQPGYLEHLMNALQAYVGKCGLQAAKIKHTALISARTGFGVEDLITKLHNLWKYKSDVYLVGCTNVGKSTLFNRLLQSDFCKVQAVDLVQRATTSVWPGTTLNLLKFPILRPEGWRQQLRLKRLSSEKEARRKEKELQMEQVKEKHRLYYLPSLVGYVGYTFKTNVPEPQTSDLFSMSNSRPTKLETEPDIGIDETSTHFSQGRWCYDTPGVMHPDQILNLLTVDELVKVVPIKPITPRFFTIKPGKSILLAGLGRLDYLQGSNGLSARFTVFSSADLPVTVMDTKEGDEVYQELLGTELMAVPSGEPDRLSQWPGLTSANEVIALTGVGWDESCADVLLSSAGWIAIAAQDDMEVLVRAWTPQARGIYVRQPCLLPFAHNFRGRRIDRTPMYHTGRAMPPNQD